jgi:hypothetical protein
MLLHPKVYRFFDYDNDDDNDDRRGGTPLLLYAPAQTRLRPPRLAV